MRHTYADTALARTDLGFVPTVTLEEGLAGRIRWLARTLVNDIRSLVGIAARSCMLAVRCRCGWCAAAARSPCRQARRSPTIPLRQGQRGARKKKWLTAREYFKQVTETYTQSPYPARRQARRSATRISAKAQPKRSSWRSTSSRSSCRSIPTNRRADYAQYKLGIAHFRQMRSPQRDQTETRDAIREFQTFVTRYPNSS